MLDRTAKKECLRSNLSSSCDSFADTGASESGVCHHSADFAIGESSGSAEEKRMSLQASETIVPFKNRTIDPSSPVQVYRCLTKRDDVWYSIRQKGKVVAHSKCLVLVDARFIVCPGGRARALREKKRNVHAYVTGLLFRGAEDMKVQGRRPIKVKYCLGPQFETADGSSYVDRAVLVRLRRSGCWAFMAERRPID